MPQVGQSFLGNIHKGDDPEKGKKRLDQQNPSQYQGNTIYGTCQMSAVAYINQVAKELWKCQISSTWTEKEQYTHGIFKPVRLKKTVKFP